MAFPCSEKVRSWIGNVGLICKASICSKNYDTKANLEKYDNVNITMINKSVIGIPGLILKSQSCDNLSFRIDFNQVLSVQGMVVHEKPNENDKISNSTNISWKKAIFSLSLDLSLVCSLYQYIFYTSNIFMREDFIKGSAK